VSVAVIIHPARFGVYAVLRCTPRLSTSLAIQTFSIIAINPS